MYTEVAGGIVLLIAAVLALVWANSPFFHSYELLWETEVDVEVGGWGLHLTLHEIVNDPSMAVFFFVVGLEIKREVVHGQLRDPRAAALPVVAASGGMVGPALLFLLLNADGPGASGWGVPMATDIAFALGALALIGKRAPTSLKVFLLTLAVADDLGAILVIRSSTSSGVAFTWLAIALVTVLAIVALRRVGLRWLPAYGLLAAVLWYAMLASGVHATIAGVVLGLWTPALPLHNRERAAAVARGHLDAVAGDAGTAVSSDAEHDDHALLAVAGTVREAVSPLARLETALHRGRRSSSCRSSPSRTRVCTCRPRAWASSSPPRSRSASSSVSCSASRWASLRSHGSRSAVVWAASPPM